MVLVWVSGFQPRLIFANLIFLAHAVNLVNWFRNILDGLPAFYFVNRSDPDDDDIEFMEKGMLALAGAVIPVQIFITLWVM